MNQDICQNQAPDRYFRGNQMEKWTTLTLSPGIELIIQCPRHCWSQNRLGGMLLVIAYNNRTVKDVMSFCVQLLMRFSGILKKRVFVHVDINNSSRQRKCGAGMLEEG